MEKETNRRVRRSETPSGEGPVRDEPDGDLVARGLEGVVLRYIRAAVLAELGVRRVRPIVHGDVVVGAVSVRLHVKVGKVDHRHVVPASNGYQNARK